MDSVPLSLIERFANMQPNQEQSWANNRCTGKKRWLSNRITLLATVAFLILVHIGSPQGVYAQPPQGEFDFGDAPDMILGGEDAYDLGPDGISVPGNFPTYWDGWSPGTSLGAIHQGPAQVWLGEEVTYEPLLDPVVISIPDAGDDGWINQDALFNPCETTLLKVQVTMAEGADLPAQLFLNAWFDGNRDGDWEDFAYCNQDGQIVAPPESLNGGDQMDPMPGQAMAFEWIVQNYVVDTARLEGTALQLRVPTVLVAHFPPAENSDDGVWLRFTLSEARALRNIVGFPSEYPNGRGPSEDPFLMPDQGDPQPGDPQPGDPQPGDPQPGDPGDMMMKVWMFGETEDYKIVPVIDLDPGDPNDPGNPDDPTDPGNPDDPTDPGNPDDPTDPGNPDEYMAPDLGDAPDSVNLADMPNMAYYPDVPGYYPTIWEKPATSPSGPKHGNAHLVWLGDWATVEDEADMGYDADGMNNIFIWDDGYATNDSDGADDGWMNWDTEFHNCQQTRLKVLVSADMQQQLPQRMYLNVWFDGNRDGDWNDISRCDNNPNGEGPVGNGEVGTEPDTLPTDANAPIGFEWIVQDAVVHTADLVDAGGHLEIVVPTVLVSHMRPELDETGFAANPQVWMRFTLSNEPAPKMRDVAIPRADGRGPHYPEMYRAGETEDYVWYPQLDEYEEPEVDEYPMSDLGDAPDSARNHYGPMAATAYWPDIPGYYPTVYMPPADYPANGPVGPLHKDARTIWLGDWVSTEFEADMDYDEDGPNNILDEGFDWSDGDYADDGWMNWEAKMPHCGDSFLKFKVGKDSSRNDLPTMVYLNVWFDGDRNGDWEGEHECNAGNVDPQPGDANMPGMASEWVIKNYPVDLTTLDFYEMGMEHYAELKVRTDLIPNLAPGAPAWMRVSIAEQPAPANPNTQMADGRGPVEGYMFGETEDYFRESSIDEHPDADLGDAPDSSNARNMNNTAYWEINQLGYFPTAWRNVEPSGPKHLDPYAVRLGPWVSAETDAASGPDEDGQNNILSWDSDTADMDQFDDGWQNQWIGLRDCRTTILEVKISKDMMRPAVDMPEKMFLNVWFDGNRDGDWDDYRPCLDENGEVTNQLSFEWIVQDMEVDIRNMADEYVYLEVPTAMILNDHTMSRPYYDDTYESPADLPEEEYPVAAYMRFMLSELPAPVGDDTEYPDGRGLAFDDAFRYGETEDYLYWPPYDPTNGGDDVPEPGDEVVTGDFGDAPDSQANASGMANSAYKFDDGTVVDGQFPTVWDDGGQNQPSGPNHADNWAIYLGYGISYEVEADRGFDMDGNNNILHRGRDVADQDMEDNGWVNQDWAVFPDCRETMLEVQITGAPSAEYDTMYLNVWFDGNRNGEWGDTKPCEDAMLPPDDGNSGQPDDDGTVRPAGGDPAMGGTIAHEWAVQNFPVDVTSLQGDLKLYVPTFIVMNDMPDMPAWVRFTLSERPVDDSAMPFQHDGRGPQYPDRYELGETEDYLYFPPFDVPDNGVPGESGEIFLNKNATNFDGIDDVLVTSASVGDTFWYNVELKHEGGTDAAEVHLFDMLPEGVHIIDGPFVDLEDGVASPLWANVHGGFGMNDEVEWMGQIWPDSKINVRFEVAVDHCPFNPERMLFNKAEAWTLNGPAVNVIAEYNVAVQCDFLDQAEDPQIFLDKWIRVERADLPDMGNSGEFEFDEIDDEFNPVDFETEFQNDFGDNFELGDGDFWFDPRFDYVEEHSTAPGRDVFFQMVLGGFSPVRETVVVSDTMPAGLDALDVSADRGIVEIADGVMTWRGQIGSNTPPAFIKLRARPNEAAFCETTIKNVAVWRMRQPDGTVMSGESNEAKLKIICRDLGDAPDSFNHYGVEMEAYPGVKAEFPTVHKLSEADELRGPMHQEAKPFHLGRGVSREREADIGGDADGINNIMVWENRGDFDDYDDGISRYDIRMAHCEPTVLKVIVAIDEASMDKLLANEGFGYLNVWLDGDRNGSWADVHQCESGDRAPEHIIIDYGIDAFDLGAGIHEIEVETSVPVFWPEELSNQPAWARATLSERQSYKMLPEGCEIGSCRFGDGRGHPDFPFALGETEDYLVRPFDADGDIPTDGADPAVEKKGRLRIRENPRSGEEEWLAEWKVEYSNDGYGLAENVTVVDTMAGAQEIVSYSSFPPRTGNKVDNEITFSIGDMAPGQIGYINMRSTLPLNTPAGTVFTNTVTISADIDEVEDNNTVVVTMTVPLQAPIITYPLPGTTCTGTITVAGRAQPGVLVDLYIDGVQVTNTDGSTETEPITGTMALTDTVLMADENGRWSFGTTLVGDGEHTIYAVARTTSGVVSQPSSTVVAIVDSSIYWNPMSLRFYDDTGHVIIPRDEDGRLDEAGWGVPLRPGTTYTVTLEVCCDSPTRIVEMEIPGVDEDVLLTDTDNDNHFVGTFTTNEEGVAEGRLRVCVTCDLIQRCSDGTVLIDPEGTVFDLITGLEIDGAEVVCLERQSVGASNADGTDAIYSRWAAEDFNDQINPQIVGEDGYFSFFTPPGTFRLQVSKEGYYPYTSKDLVVVDEPVHFDVPLMPEIDLNSETGDIVILTIDENGFNPPLREIEPGTIVKFINLDTDAHSATSTMTESLTFNGSPSVVSAAGILATDAWDTGLIESGDEFVTKFAGTGTFTYYDAANPSNTATIVVKEGAEAPPADLATVGDEDDTDVPDPGDGGSGSNTLYLPFTAK